MSTSPAHPLVSIVIPTFNGERYFMEALESCLSQTYSNIEVIIVDDFSSDNSAKLAESVAVRDSRVRVIRRDVNGGVSRAFNTGFRVATGRYLTRLAQDDAFYPHAIEIMVDTLERENGIDIAYCDMDQIDENGSVLYQLITNPPSTALLPCNRLGLCVMWSRALMDTVGWFDPKAELAEDYDFWLRASLLDFKFFKVQAAPQIKFRLHKSQASITKVRQCDAAVIRVHIQYLWRLVKRSPFSLRRWMKLLRSLARFALFTCKHGWVSSGR
jgi:glycosyltransferase involved in cell wall biosynthesis